MFLKQDYGIISVKPISDLPPLYF